MSRCVMFHGTEDDLNKLEIKSTVNKQIVFGTVFLSLFLSALDQTIVVIATLQ